MVSKWTRELNWDSPTSGGRSVGMVRSRTQTMEFRLVYIQGGSILIAVGNSKYSDVFQMNDKTLLDILF
jgi:hypothetical protein